VALVADLLSVPTLGRWPTLDLVPQRRRERLLQALLRRMRGLAARRPVLAVVEDAHWVDPTTRELLDLLVAEAPSMALLLVVTHRPEFDAAAWLGQPHVTPVQLNRLARAEHLDLLRRVAGGKALPPEVEAEVLAHTDGVPLFVEEVGRAVLEGGLLREEADRWVLEGAMPSFAVPASLQSSLVARLDRLSSVREVAQAAAVIGREFAHDLLAAVSGQPETALREAIDTLAGADLVQRRGTPPHAVYAFRHALIQDATHATLLRERRTRAAPPRRQGHRAAPSRSRGTRAGGAGPPPGGGGRGRGGHRALPPRGREVGGARRLPRGARPSGPRHGSAARSAGRGDGEAARGGAAHHPRRRGHRRHGAGRGRGRAGLFARGRALPRCRRQGAPQVGRRGPVRPKALRRRPPGGAAAGRGGRRASPARARPRPPVARRSAGRSASSG
jgi:hypothetical protein